jgi:predicted enzyme related to lactoylglutathione lyase
MPEVTAHKPGSFCWVELGTNDTEAAKKFYTSLFGWTADDVPAGPDMTYTLLRLNGKDVGGLYQLTEQYHKGVPPHWLCYVAATKVDDTAAKAKQLGATLMLEPFDVMDIGRMAMFQDPQGAALALWEKRSHIGAGVRDELNTMCWNELATTDTAKASDFYAKLFGWEYKKGEAGGMEYTEIKNAGQEIGGIYKLMEEMKGVPPNWIAYWAVADCDATAEKAKSLGGALAVPPTDIPNVGRFSYIMDPQGAAFAVIQLKMG